jgi:hypothetical protein
MCVRGPSRTSQDQAESDAKKLTAAAEIGPKEVREVANRMQRTKKGRD